MLSADKSADKIEKKWAEIGEGELWLDHMNGSAMFAMYIALEFTAEEKRVEHTSDPMEESEMIQILSENGMTIANLDTLLGALISIELLRAKFGEAENDLFGIAEQLGEELDLLIIYMAKFIKVLGGNNTRLVLETIDAIRSKLRAVIS